MACRFWVYFLGWAVWGVSIGLAFDPILYHKSDGDRVTVIIGGKGATTLDLEMAITPPAQAKGLMNRTALTQGDGMLFVYQTPVRARFWMKNTLIALDMIFIDSNGIIVFIHKNAQPHDLTPIQSPGPVSAVLEMPADHGVDYYGIQVGNRVWVGDHSP